jgi:hypothetical protein
MSVAKIWNSGASTSVAACSASTMATEYTSSPVAHPTTHTRTASPGPLPLNRPGMSDASAIERLRVTEEAAYRDEQVPQQRLALRGVRLQDRHVLLQRGHVVEAQTSVQTPEHHGALVLAEIVPRSAPQRGEHAGQAALRLRRRRRLLDPAVRPPAQPDQLTRHPLRWQHQVDQTRRDGAHRHAVVFRLARRLRHRDPARAPDVADPRRPVLARPRQHHTYRLRAVRLSQRPEEQVHRRVLRTLPPVAQGDGLPTHGQIPARRDDVHVVRLHARRPADLRHRDHRPVLEQLRQPTLPRWIQVHDHDIRHAAVLRHRLHELLERLQSTRRRTDPDHRQRRRTGLRGSVFGRVARGSGGLHAVTSREQ